VNKFKKAMATPPTSEPRAPVTEEAIGERAYELYLQRGRQDGQAIEDWLAAEAQLRNIKGKGTAN